MNKLAIVIVLIVSVVICNGSPARLTRVKSSKSSLLANQEVAQDTPAPTPYPAVGFRPELRFTLPIDEKLVAPDNKYLPPVGEPAKTYGPPLKTYGPPEISVKNDVEKVPSEDPVESEKPNPDEPNIKDDQSSEVSEDVQATAVSRDLPAIQTSDEQPAEDISEKESETDEIEEIIKEIEAEEDLIDSIPQRFIIAKTMGRNTSMARVAKLQLAPPQRRQAFEIKPIYLIRGNGQFYKLLK